MPIPRIAGGWDPEDASMWRASGRSIALKNLAVSTFALFLSFSVSTLGALVAVRLNQAGFGFSRQELFFLAALPGLVGATGRLAYTYLPALMGGRAFTLASLALMMVPLAGLGFALQDPATPFWQMVLWFSLLGPALSHFSGSMANIGEFFPRRNRGTANGINAGVGNLGVAAAYLVAPIAMGASISPMPGCAPFSLHRACFLLIPSLAVALILVALFMDDVPVERQSPSQALAPFKRANLWLMAVVYSCGFGSFIGYSMAFPLIVATVFPQSGSDWFIFLGPLVGAGIRPVGGWLSDRIQSGARVALVSLVVMLLATIGVACGVAQGDFALFFWCMMVLFSGTGLVNGASFRMIPHLFESRTTAGQVTGIVSAFAAYGAFFVPMLFRLDYLQALAALAVFTAATALLTWFAYARRRAPFPC
ncbi:MAG: MFS transporter [Berryella intestinalis]|nr:MFS transporter [Berryella intestinalis]